VTFEGGTDPDTAQVQVKTRSRWPRRCFPQEVQQQGVQVNKSVRNFLIVVGLISEDGSMSATDLADYNSSVMRDPISRLPGVGEIQTFGTQYAMRIWLDPTN
jgi:multidrug efflux pump subunit AcrB